MESTKYTLDDHHDASPRKAQPAWSPAGQATIGIFFGMLPFLLMLYFTMLIFTSGDRVSSLQRHKCSDQWLWREHHSCLCGLRGLPFL